MKILVRKMVKEFWVAMSKTANIILGGIGTEDGSDNFSKEVSSFIAGTFGNIY